MTARAADPDPRWLGLAKGPSGPLNKIVMKRPARHAGVAAKADASKRRRFNISRLQMRKRGARRRVFALQQCTSGDPANGHGNSAGSIDLVPMDEASERATAGL